MLSELQKVLIGGFKVCGLHTEDIVAAITLLQTEEQQWAAVDYLEDVLYNPPDRTEVFAKVVELTL